VKAEKLNDASIAKRNFVRSKLLQLSRQKWQSAAEVEGVSVNHQRAMNTTGLQLNSYSLI